MSNSGGLAEYLTHAAKGGSLTAADRRLIDVLVSDPDLAAFGSAAEVAVKARSSAATVVRSARRLGFAGWTELQDAAREQLRVVPRRATARITAGKKSVSSAIDDIARHVASVASLTTEGEFEEIVSALSDRSKGVWIVSGHEGAGIAVLFADRLAAARSTVHCIAPDPMEAARCVVDFKSGDVAVVIDLARNDSALAPITQIAVERGLVTFGILDSPGGRLGAMCSHVIAVPPCDIGPFDSYVTVLSIVESVAALAAIALKSSAADRLADLESIWDRWSLLDP